MKVVADTMIWVSYCTRRDGIRHQIIDRARKQRVRFRVSEYILDELSRTLIRDLGFSRRFAFLARRAVLRIAKLVPIPKNPPRYVPGDPHDDPIVQTALSSRAHYLVTADTEILKVKRVRGVEVVTLRQFVLRLASES